MSAPMNITLDKDLYSLLTRLVEAAELIESHFEEISTQLIANKEGRKQHASSSEASTM